MNAPRQPALIAVASELGDMQSKLEAGDKIRKPSRLLGWLDENHGEHHGLSAEIRKVYGRTLAIGEPGRYSILKRQVCSSPRLIHLMQSPWH